MQKPLKHKGDRKIQQPLVAVSSATFSKDKIISQISQLNEQHLQNGISFSIKHQPSTVDITHKKNSKSAFLNQQERENKQQLLGLLFSLGNQSGHNMGTDQDNYQVIREHQVRQISVTGQQKLNPKQQNSITLYPDGGLVKKDFKGDTVPVNHAQLEKQIKLVNGQQVSIQRNEANLGLNSLGFKNSTEVNNQHPKILSLSNQAQMKPANQMNQQSQSQTTRQPTSIANQSKDLVQSNFLISHTNKSNHPQLSQKNSLAKVQFFGQHKQVGSIELCSPVTNLKGTIHHEYSNTEDEPTKVDPGFLSAGGPARPNFSLYEASDRLYHQSVHLEQQIKSGLEKNKKLKAALQLSHYNFNGTDNRLISHMKVIESGSQRDKYMYQNSSISTKMKSQELSSKNQVLNRKHQNLIDGLSGYDRNTKQLVQQILNDSANHPTITKKVKTGKKKTSTATNKNSIPRSPQQIQINKYLSQQPSGLNHDMTATPEAIKQEILFRDIRESTTAANRNVFEQNMTELNSIQNNSSIVAESNIRRVDNCGTSESPTRNMKMKHEIKPIGSGYMLKRRQQQRSTKPTDKIGPYHNLQEKDDLTELELAEVSMDNNRASKLPEAYSKVLSHSQVCYGNKVSYIENKSNHSTQRSPCNIRQEESGHHQQMFASTLAKGKNSKLSEHYNLNNYSVNNKLKQASLMEPSTRMNDFNLSILQQETSPMKWHQGDHGKNPIQNGALNIFRNKCESVYDTKKQKPSAPFKQDKDLHLLQISSYPQQFGNSGGGVVSSPSQMAELQRILSQNLDDRSPSNEMSANHTKMSLFNHIDSRESPDFKDQRRILDQQDQRKFIKLSNKQAEEDKEGHQISNRSKSYSSPPRNPEAFSNNKKFILPTPKQSNCGDIVTQNFSPSTNQFVSQIAGNQPSHHATMVSKEEMNQMYPELTFTNQNRIGHMADKLATKKAEIGHHKRKKQNQILSNKAQDLIFTQNYTNSVFQKNQSNRNMHQLKNGHHQSLRSSQDSLSCPAAAAKAQYRKASLGYNEHTSITEQDIDTDRIVMIGPSHRNPRPVKESDSRQNPHQLNKLGSMKKSKQVKSKVTSKKKQTIISASMNMKEDEQKLCPDYQSQFSSTHNLKQQVEEPDQEEKYSKLLNNKMSQEKYEGSQKRSAKQLKTTNKSQGAIKQEKPAVEKQPEKLLIGQKQHCFDTIKQAYKDQKREVITPLYKFSILPGNNSNLIERVMRETIRRLCWQTEQKAAIHQQYTNGFQIDGRQVYQSARRGGGLSAYHQGNSTNYGSNMNSSNFGGSTRIPTPLKVHFKWSPCSIKGDFMKLSHSSHMPNGTTHGIQFQKPIRNTGFSKSIMQRGANLNTLIRPRHLINHFEGHKELTRKDDLICNLKTQLQHENENLYDYTPITFHIALPEGKHPSLESFFKKFLSLYEVLASNRGMVRQFAKQHFNQVTHSKTPWPSTDADSKLKKSYEGEEASGHLLMERFPDINMKLINITMHRGPQFRAMLQRENSTKFVMPLCHFVGGNYWVLKTTNQNRGIGIHVFRTLNELNSILYTYISNDKSAMSSTMRQSSGLKDLRASTSLVGGLCDLKTGDKVPNILFGGPVQVAKNMSFILQKYIEKPLLIHRRKFDIRVWVLINQDMEVYFFKEGYLRMSAVEYKLDNCKDQYVHLTNNAIQKNAKEYGRFEDGNQLDFTQFQEYINKFHADKKFSVKDDLVEDIKFTIVKTIDSVKKKLDPNKRSGCFELFGYDFMVDSDFSVWLIEVNTNPCLEESSSILRTLLPRMIDDAFKLTIDRDFPGLLSKQKHDLEAFMKNLKSQQQQTYPHVYGKAGDLKSTRQKHEQIQNEQAAKTALQTKLQMAEHLHRQIEHDLWAQNSSIYSVEGHSDYDNMWQKIMDIRSTASGQACKQRFNLKASERILRTQCCLYTPFDHTKKLFLSDYASYKQFKEQQKCSVAQIHL